MGRHLPQVWLAGALVLLLAACGSDNRRGLNPEEWATISAYQQQVSELQTQVAALVTTIPSPAVASPTPTAAFGDTWTLTITGVSRAGEVPSGTPAGAGATPITTPSVFLVLDLSAANQTAEPLPRFPWWQLRLRDAQGRTFTPHEDATTAYRTGHSGIERPEAYQPGIAYHEGIVFEIPQEARDLSLRSTDESLVIPLPEDGAVGTPSPSSG